jgi:hypothetical protein
MSPDPTIWTKLIMMLQNHRFGPGTLRHIDETTIALQQSCPNQRVIILDLDVFHHPDPKIGHDRDQSLIEGSVVQRRET